MIKNLEDLKEYNIICTNIDEIKDCFEILRELGFETGTLFIGEEERIISFDKKFFYSTKNIRTDYKDINFYNFKKQTKKFLKEKEEKLPDLEVASDGRITKVNNYGSEKLLFASGYWDNFTINFSFINKDNIEYLTNLGLVFESKEMRDKFEKRQEIYIKLKNLAERLNKGQKIDWNNYNQNKYYLRYDYKEKKILQSFNIFSQKVNTAYCLDYNFLEIAKKEIGEENLLKLFED